MRLSPCHPPRQRRPAAAFTLVEIMVSVGLGITLLAGVAILFINANECFVAMANYQNLDKYSCNALDLLSREIRGTSAVTTYNTSSITFTNASQGTSLVITYNSGNSNLVMSGTQVQSDTGSSSVTNLTGVSSWGYTLYMGVPNTNSFTTNIVFYTATNAASAKIVQMNWRCVRKYEGASLESESVQEARIVLRNKTSS